MANSTDIMKKAKQLFESDYAQVIKNGVLFPSKNRDPIFPPLTVVEYAAMEKDTAKYFLYYAAIRAELDSLQKQKLLNSEDTGICCMVVGAGRGRLVDFCIDCFSELNLAGSIFVIECNVLANQFLQERYQNNENVFVLSSLVIRTREELELGLDQKIYDEQWKTLFGKAHIDVFVSELLGSFGDNEFLSEILTTCIDLFGKKNFVSIPSSYSTYICAIHSSTLQSYFEEHNDSAMYILGIPEDAVMLSNLVKVYEQSCTTVCEEIQANITLKMKKKTSAYCVTGLAGYFRANLNSDIIIDTTLTESRNTFFWETAFFPLPNVTSKTEIEMLSIYFKRKSSRKAVLKENIFNLKYPLLKANYEWRITDTNLFSSTGTHEISL